jgi:ferric-dicitrate binding protein FerR (iron transport regulator)
MLEGTDDNSIADHVKEIAALLHKHLKGELAAEEQKRLDDWLSQSEQNRLLLQKISDREQLTNEVKEYYDIRQQIEKLAARHSREKARVVNLFSKKTTWLRWVAAAAVMLLLAAGTFFFLTPQKKNQFTTTANINRVVNDIAPGQFKAKLTLDNGTTIILDSAKVGQLAQQGRTTIVNKDGELVYNIPSNTGGSEGAVLYNTLTTSRGETYTTTLSDGSRIWLNAESSIRYPVSFTGSERNVEITGEAYLEVKHNAQKPFKVHLPNGSVVEDLGTAFNINAYSNEASIKTTLIEGSVRVFRQIGTLGGGQRTVILKPGEQAIDKSNSSITIDHSPDIEQVTAWKNGSFQFNGETLEAVMRQLERWYNVETVYQTKDTNKRFGGMISRNTKLSEVLKALELSDVHFIIEGKKIIVQ